MTTAISLAGRMACIFTVITAFSPNLQNHVSKATSLLASNNNNGFDGFNPFQPGSKISNSNTGIIIGNKSSNNTPGGRISPRAIRMKEVTSALLNSISDSDSVQQILLEHEEFLLEQFDNLDAVLEEDSIFTPDMSRSERFERYRKVMEERIGGARVPAARNTLTALKEFVVSRE